jgi:hypothetical protein
MNLRCRKLWRSVSLLALGTALGMAPYSGSPLPDQVEEDWQAVVATPDVLGVGPQMTMVMSPNADPAAAFVTFYLNYRDYPNWQPGGLQLKAYGAASGPSAAPPLLDTDTHGTEVCSTTGETISWTQRMSLSSGSVRVNVVNGQSTTWGNFGQGDGSLGVSFSSSVSDLGSYQPTYSVSKSGASWQANRVTSMTLLQVRYYNNGQLISTDSTPRTVNLNSGG